MSNLPTRNTKISIPMQLEQGDIYTISGADNFAVMQIKKSNGMVQTATLKTNKTGALTQKVYTQYDPALQSIDDRKNTIKELKKSGLSQVEIAKMLGISQSTVSNVLKK